MRRETTLYPVDRYLVESSKRVDMINIIDDDIWNPEPALRPDEEIILRKLHDMLQSTADDLKLLSGELSRYHEPGVVKKTLPTPLDEEFNEKVHIEDLVNAKFHGHKLVNNLKPSPPQTAQNNIPVLNLIKSSTKKVTNASVQVNEVPTLKIPSVKKKLGISGTKTLQINEESKSNLLPKSTKNNLQENKTSKVALNQFHYKHVEEHKLNTIPQKSLQVQEMPSINIRSQLKAQKVLQLDIKPEEAEKQNEPVRSNALVIEMEYKPAENMKASEPVTFEHINLLPKKSIQQTKRKISVLPAFESSESTNNVSSETQRDLKKQKPKRPNTRISLSTDPGKSGIMRKKCDTKVNVKRPQSDLQEWNKKLKIVYGKTSKNSKIKAKKVSPKRSYIKNNEHRNRNSGINNIEYIPYSKLTLGGVSVSDIEKELSNISNKKDIVLSPILDKILSSRENSFSKSSPRKQKKNSNILTTSDENLLQEVLDIEKHVTETLSAKNSNENKTSEEDISIKNSNDSDSYGDDFEDDKSDDTKHEDISPGSDKLKPEQNNSNNSNSDRNRKHVNDKTFTKVLSFKNEVDIFEFIHSVDTQDTATQSGVSNKIKPQETQTSPIRSIRNDLWPSIDPRGEVEKLFELEKDFIKKLIIEEYGDILEKNINKPSTSKDNESESFKNIAASQKNTQTSPAHVKSVMTSPTRTKNRTTSPFALSLTVNKQTSPLLVVSNEDEIKVEIEKDDDLGISVNLSSPRFSLRLPQTTRDVLSNFDPEPNSRKKMGNLHKYISSSSSVDGDYSSSDISSLGEIHKKYRRKLRRIKIPSISEVSSSSLMSTSSTSTSGAILPLRSEGETSAGQINKKSNKICKSEGELSLGQ